MDTYVFLTLCLNWSVFEIRGFLFNFKWRSGALSGRSLAYRQMLNVLIHFWLYATARSKRKNRVFSLCNTIPICSMFTLFNTNPRTAPRTKIANPCVRFV